MSHSARGVRPTDLLALVSFDGRVFRNEAITWDRLCRMNEPPSVVESALEGMLSFATGRHTWISVENQRIRALVSGRRRGGAIAWEVDSLLTTDELPSAAPGLLNQLAETARRGGAQRVLLRLPVDSPARPIAEGAGFGPYREETVFVGEPPPPSGEPPAGFRLREPSDAHALFRLYVQAEPAAMRAQEASTLQQWLALRERDGTKKHAEYVLEAPNGDLTALVRVARDQDAVRLMPVLLHPGSMHLAEPLMSAALRPWSSGNVRAVVALVPGELGGIRPVLEGWGWREQARCIVLARQLARPVKVRRRMFARVAERTAPVRGALA